MDVQEKLPIRLRELREQAGLTQADLAEKALTEKVQISRYELGAMRPSVITLVKLADIFDCSADYLLGRSNSVRLGDVVSEDWTSEERRLIQAIRDQDIQSALLVLALLVPRPNVRKTRADYDSRRRVEPRADRMRRQEERMESHRSQPANGEE